MGLGLVQITVETSALSDRYTWVADRMQDGSKLCIRYRRTVKGKLHEVVGLIPGNRLNSRFLRYGGPVLTKLLFNVRFD
jgi:hypothetical protein